MSSFSSQMLATLLIFRQFLQNIKEVLQPYLYEQNKLGVFTPKVLWELLQAIMLKYGRLALGKAQASMTAYSFLGPRVIPVNHAANSNLEPRRRGDLKAGFRLTEEEWDMSDPGGSWSSLQTTAAVNASWTEGTELAATGQTQLLLEILMVLMCLGAVTGRLHSQATCCHFIYFKAFFLFLFHFFPFQLFKHNASLELVDKKPILRFVKQRRIKSLLYHLSCDELIFMVA